jgi:hypothetical protein
MDFGAILTRSKDLTLKNKWLWVYGMVIATLTFSTGASYNFSNGRWEKLPANNQKALEMAGKAINNWLSSIPTQSWILFGAGILLLVILSIVINWVTMAWAKGSLIGGLNDAQNDKKVDLENTSGYGLKSLKKLIIFNIINSLIFSGIIVVLFSIYGLVALVLSFVQPLMILWLIAAGILGFFTMIILMVILAMVGVYAERLIVLKGFTPIEAWKKGLSLGKNNFLNTILMGLTNSAVGCSIGCLTNIILLFALSIPGLFFAVPFFSGKFPLVSIVGLLILVLAYLYAGFLIRAGIVVFTYSNWNQFYKQIYEK